MDANGSPRTIDRRDFLKTTAAAGLALGTRSLAASAGGTNDLRVALVGGGNQGMVLLESCQKIPNVRITALCDIWKEYRQKYVSGRLRTYGHEHTAYVDIAEMLDKEKGRLDAAIIVVYLVGIVGLGFTGLGNALAMLNLRYDTQAARDMVEAPRAVR